MCYGLFFFFKQKTAYEMRISDWSSDVCSSDLQPAPPGVDGIDEHEGDEALHVAGAAGVKPVVLSGQREGIGAPVLAVDRNDIDMEIGRASCRERVCQYV